MSDIWELLGQLTSGDDDLAEGAVSKIILSAGEALPALQELLHSSSIDNRWWSVRVLSEIHDAAVPSLLCQALQDSSLEVRQCAALGLCRQPTPDAVSLLIPLLRSRDQVLSGLAVEALIAIGPLAVHPLMHVLRQGSKGERRLAARALAMIGDACSIPALCAALEDASPMVVYWAERGLERMGVGLLLYRPE
ncbi:MAG: HEAT repeat domain-containing protein [Chloroflexota bacterium]